MCTRANCLTLLSVVALSACVQTQATMLGPTRGFAPVAESDVLIFLSEADLPEGCEKIALINAQGESSMTNEAGMLKAARKKAGSVGANGLIVGDIDEPSTGAKIAGAVFGVGATRRGEMVAVRCP